MFVLCGCVLILSGCGRSDRLPTAKVTGKVTLNGDPLPIGSLLFVPDKGGPTSQGRIAADGRYSMGTYTETDGAILGTHKVMITALKAPEGAGLPEDVRKGNAAPLSVIPEIYGDLEKSGLIADVKESGNQINFELTSTPGRPK
jgi:hypothetical protein